ncbi:MAG: exodeoxyribonuclease VII large subunit [bacterium]|nr:exodeoxyribonuclease VII large subunit [bacterium]
MKIYSILEYNQLVKSTLEAQVGLIAIQGEVSGFRVQKDRLIYFELKDKEARCLCFMMKWDLRVQLEDGMEIKALGAPSVFQGSGGLHFRATEVELVGEGALAKQFEMLKKKLEAEGLFAPERKRALPRFPERIGLITSTGAAAYDDVLRVLANRWGGIEIQFYPVSVQGFGAVESIVEAFLWFNKIDITPPAPPLTLRGGNCGVDVIILTRGGGSLEDLQAFNSEQVARAIFGSRVPVVCGVGHERDISIADLVADVRAATPSNAAEIVAPDRREVAQRLAYSIERMVDGVDGMIEEKQSTIKHAMELGARFIERYKEQIDHLFRTLQNLNPLNILKRGYSVVMKGDRVIKDSSQVAEGDVIDVRLHSGVFKGTVI